MTALADQRALINKVGFAVARQIIFCAATSVSGRKELIQGVLMLVHFLLLGKALNVKRVHVAVWCGGPALHAG